MVFKKVILINYFKINNFKKVILINSFNKIIVINNLKKVILINRFYANKQFQKSYFNNFFY